MLMRPGVWRAIQRQYEKAGLETGGRGRGPGASTRPADYKGSQLKYRKPHEPGFINKRPQVMTET